MIQSERIPLLDFYRFFAAMSVVGFHYGSNLLSSSRVNLQFGRIFDFPNVDSFLNYGIFGVDLFFLISGFVIALSAEGRSFASFSASRITRILPTYWLAIVLTSVLLLILDSGFQEITARQVIANLAFLQGPFHEPYIDGVYWTIAIEIRFYALVALLIAFKIYRFYPWFLLSWVLLCYADFIKLPIGPLRQLFITSYGYYFAAGGAFYFLHHRRHIKLSLLIIILSLLISVPKGCELISQKLGQDVSLSAAVVVMTCYGLMALISTRWFDNIHWRWLPIAGALTYPLYLLHENIGFVLMRLLNFTSNGFILTLMIIMLMLIASWLIHRYFEQNVCPWLRRYLENNLTYLMQKSQKNFLRKLPNDI